VRVIVVCLANTCRSPVAEALLREALHGDTQVEVASRGLFGGAGETPAALSAALEAARVTLAASPSGTALDRDEARSADLLLFMERRLLREAVVADATIWPHSFTLREFARRGWMNPPEREIETFDQWRHVLHSSRHREELLGRDADDDVPDPGLDGDELAYSQMIECLRTDVGRVAPLLTGWRSSAA
jgi:low molecular weight protein-tyrosine phosphatase